MNHWQRIRMISFLLVICFLLSACGSASEGIVIVSGVATEDPENFAYGFSFEGEEVTSPGPTITVRKGETVTITFKNETSFENGNPAYGPHNFTIVADKDVNVSDMQPLWGAHVGGSGDPDIKYGESGSVTFIAEDGGSFFYLCNVYGHHAIGMWGRFIVEEIEE